MLSALKIAEVISLKSGLGFPRENFIPCDLQYIRIAGICKALFVPESKMALDKQRLFAVSFLKRSRSKNVVLLYNL